MKYCFLLLLSCSAAIARDGRYAFASIPIGESVGATLSEGTTTCGGIVTASPPTPPAATTACTVTGSVTFRQNFFTGANADYEVWLTGSGIQPATQYMVGFSTDCSLAATTAGSVAEQMLWQQLNNAVLSPFVMTKGESTALFSCCQSICSATDPAVVAAKEQSVENPTIYCVAGCIPDPVSHTS